MDKLQPTLRTIDSFLRGKSAHTLSLFSHFVAEYKNLGDVSFIPAKTMIGIATSRKRIGYITQFGKNFIHVVFHFDQPYPDNLCFQKIAQVPGEKQYNHHFRMMATEDINDEVRKYMRLAFEINS